MRTCPTCGGLGVLPDGALIVYRFAGGHGAEHLVDDVDPTRTACGLELAGAQLVLASGRRCRWCVYAGAGHAELDLEAA